MIATAVACATRLVSGAIVDWQCPILSDVPRIYFANHSSHLDFLVIWAALPATLRDRTRPVAGRDYWERGRARCYLASRVFRAVLVDRRRPGEDAHASARLSTGLMAQHLDHHESLILFPEGTRSCDGKVGTFKSGLYHLAKMRPHAELVPVWLENLNRILPKGEVLPVPMISRVVFGRPLHIGGDEDKAAFLERTRAALIQLRASA